MIAAFYGHNEIRMKIAIGATFTAEPLERTIRLWAGEIGVPLDIVFAPFNQPSQTLLDPGSVFGLNPHGVNVLLIRSEDLLEADPVAHARELAEQLRIHSRQVVVCLPKSASVHAAQVEIAFAGIPNAVLIPSGDIDRLYPVTDWYSEQGDRTGKLPYTEAYLAALGTVIVRTALALRRPPYKVIAVDCDNTLWRGVCGEDGPMGVVIEPDRRLFHEFLLRKRAEGMLLVIASKNNRSDVEETFRLRAGDMPLRLEDFTAARIDWQPKANHLRGVARELNLGLDSFLFLDDDAKECQEMQELAPEVLTVPVPRDADAIREYLDHIWAFDRGPVTAEDTRRAEMYESAREFSAAAASASSYEQFIESLGLRVDIREMTAERLGRSAQLTQRTNQFNASTRRRTEAEMAGLAEQGLSCWTVDVADRFGDHGQTGLIIFGTRPNALAVDTLLLSCRVLGRGVEHRLLAALAAEAARRGLNDIDIAFEETAKNGPVREFLTQVAEECGISGFRFPAAPLRALRWKPSVRTETAEAERSPAPAALPYVHVARTLNTAERIVAAQRRGLTPAAQGAFTETERKLAGIWAEILEANAIAPEDNFFDLGGHSLLVVLLQMRVQETFGVELEVDDVYSGNLTLAGLAAKVEMRQAGDLSADDYRRLVAEIEALTDEEVRGLLALEERAG